MREYIESAFLRMSGKPGMLALTAFCLLAVIVLTGLFLFYLIRCSKMKKTEMHGIAEISVDLNYHTMEGRVPLSMGTYYIGLEDSGATESNGADPEDLFCPELSFLQKAEVREYPVSTFLKRFQMDYAAAREPEDEGTRFFQNLTKDMNFCDSLGSISYRSKKRGLECNLSEKTEKDPAEPNKIRVIADLPSSLRDALSVADSLFAQNICITIKYDPMKGQGAR